MDNSLPFYTYRYALIKDGVVGNIIVVDSYPTAGHIAQSTGYDEVVCVDQYLVTIGDRYENGEFIHEGNEIQRQLTLEEKAYDAQQRISDLETLVLQLGGVI